MSDKKQNVEDLFKYKPTKEQLEYYYLDEEVLCCDKNLKPMFDDIKDFNFIEQTNKLYKYFGVKYYEDLFNKYENHKFDNPFYIEQYDEDLDSIMMNYVKSIDDIKCIVLYPSSEIMKINESDFINYIKQFGNTHCIKEMSLTKKQIQGLLFQINYDNGGYKNFNNILNMQNKFKADNKVNKIFFILWKPKNKNIDVHNIVNDFFRNRSDYNEALYSHICDNNTKTYELIQIITNRNTMRCLHYQRLDRILGKEFAKERKFSFSLLNTFKNLIYTNIDTIDISRIMLFSSAVLFSFGVRNIHDLDMMFYMIGNKKEKLDELIVKFFIDEKEGFPLFDIHTKNEDGWYCGSVLTPYLSEWFDKDWPNLYNSDSMTDTFFNPKHHFYFLGIKIISFNADVKRRIKRSRPAAYADLIAIIDILGIEIGVPCLPSGFWKNHVYYEFTDKEIKKLYGTIKWYLKTRYDMIYDIEQIKKIIKKN